MQRGDVFNPKGLFYGALIPNWLLRRKEVNGCAKLVYGRLYQYCNDQGRAFPRIEALADEVGCSPTGVKNAIRELEEAGLVRVEDHFGTHQSSDYYFLWHTWIEEGVEIKRVDRGLNSRPCGVQNLDLAGSKNLTSRGLNFRPPLNKISGKESAEQNQIDPASPPATRSIPSPEAAASSLAPPPPDVEREKENAPKDELETVEAPQTVEAIIELDSDASRRLMKARLEEERAKLKADEERMRKEARRVQRELRQRLLEESPDTSSFAPKGSPAHKLFKKWTEEFAAAYPDVPTPKRWRPKEYAIANSMLSQYSYEDVEGAAVYLIRNWSLIRTRFFGKNAWPAPTIGGLSHGLSALVTEAQIWMQYGHDVEAYQAYGDKYQQRPKDVMERYLVAKEELKKLGFEV